MLRKTRPKITLFMPENFPLYISYVVCCKKLTRNFIIMIYRRLCLSYLRMHYFIAENFSIPAHPPISSGTERRIRRFIFAEMGFFQLVVCVSERSLQFISGCYGPMQSHIGNKSPIVCFGPNRMQHHFQLECFLHRKNNGLNRFRFLSTIKRNKRRSLL